MITSAMTPDVQKVKMIAQLAEFWHMYEISPLHSLILFFFL